jgi:hypothetical protein
MYGDRPDPVTAATSFVADRFPGALTAFVGGGVLTEHRTPTSDLDVVVVLDGPPAPFRETFEHAGWIVEAFVHTRASLDTFWDSDARRRVCSLLRMCTESVVLLDPGGVADEIRTTAAARIAAGPRRLEDAEWEQLRYALTDLLDDMAGCDDEAELLFIAGAVVRDVATLALELAGEWSARGKALPRALARVDPDLLERLVSGHRHVVNYADTAVLHRAAVDVLMAAGGALMVGYRAGGDPGRAAEAAPEGGVGRTTGGGG